MRLLLRTAFLLGLAILAGCAGFNRNRLSLQETNFGKEVDLAQNLVFTFNHDVVPDNKLESWDTTQYVQFIPPIAGRFKWTGKNELVFSPEATFKPSTDYKALLKAALLSQTGGQNLKLEADEPVAFHTPYLEIAGARTFWSKHRGGGITGRVELKFNYPVNPTQVGQLVQVKLAGKPVAITVLSEQPTDAVQLQLAPTQLDPAEAVELEVLIQPGLHCEGSNWNSNQVMEYTSSFPAQNDFSITGVEVEPEGDEGIIRIYTTQALLADGLSKYVHLTPTVDYTVEALDNGLQLKGNFNIETSYTLTLLQGLPSILGIQLAKPYEQSISFGAQAESIRFTSAKGTYLAAKNSHQVGLRISQVGEVKVKIYKVYENNLMAFMRQSSYGYDYEDGGGNNYDYAQTEPYADVVLERSYETRTLPRHNGYRLLDLNFTDNRKDYQGIYLVEVASKEHYYTRATKLLAITDIGLIARQSGKEVVVFANSLQTTQPLEKVQLTLISTNNQTMLKATTNAQGMAVFKDVAQAAPKFTSALISAHLNNDYSYLLLSNSRVETSRFEVGGKTLAGRDYDAYLYGDREIYRPGDTVYLNSVVRTLGWDAVQDMPVQLKVLSPTGKEFITQRGTLNRQGAFSTSFPVASSAPTGTYQLELRTGDDQLLTTRPISVEEFLPDRLKVTLKQDHERVLPGQDLLLSGEALNLFGPPATGRDYAVELTLKSVPFETKDFAAYNFGLQLAPTPAGESRSGRTDSEGKFEERFTLFRLNPNLGLLKATFFATVFDENNRPVHRAATVDVLTQQVFYGIKTFDSYQSTRQPLMVGLVALDVNGKALPTATAHVQVIKNNWEYLYQRVNGSLRYVSQNREQLVVDKMVQLSGATSSFAFTPLLPGEYEIRLRKPGAKAYVAQQFYAFGGGDGASFEVNNEGNVLIEADKKSYKRGDKAQLLFKAPFEGKLLVTWERDRVVGHTYLTTQNRAATYTLSLEDAAAPNLYVSATLLRPMDGSEQPLTVAHGFISLPVESPANKLEVSITAPEASLSRVRQTVSVHTAPGAELTVAVVDEGILQVKNTESPDAYKYFFGKRALEVTPYDLYGYLLPDINRNGSRSSTGGDADAAPGVASRLNPLSDKRVRLVALWSGTLTADASGNANFSFQIPQFSGALRIMAVAYKNTSFGGASRMLRVADPVVISTGLPRFLSPRDSVLVPVTLTNTTGKAVQATATLATSGAVAGLGNLRQQALLPAKGEARLLFKLYAQPTIGSARVELKVGALGTTFVDVTELSVRPASPLVRQTGSGGVLAGQTATLDLQAGDLMPGGRTGRVVLSKNPLVQFATNLNDLLGYPHGCVEQTVAKAFPQLYYTDLVKAIRAKPLANVSPAFDIQAAISKLQTMQQEDGGMSFWPGGTEESWWGTAFAAHFLLEANKEGYTVDSKLLSRSLDYLESQCSRKQTTTYYLLDGQKRTLANREIFYSLFVLALGGRSPLATMNYHKASPNNLTQDSRYLLAATYALLGDRRSFTYLLPQGFEGNFTQPEFGRSFSSPIRDEALALYTLLEVDARNAQVPVLSRSLSEGLKNRPYLSTQENVFAFLALGKFARQANAAQVSGTLTAGGKTLGSFTGADLVIASGVAGQRLQLATQGQGSLYYSWEVNGIPADGQSKEEDSHLRVRRSYYSRQGVQLTTANFTQNELVVVRLTVEAAEDEPVANVVVTDLLPAGLEIENPRINDLPGMAWVHDRSEPDYLDIRDDRIFFYTDLTEKKNFYYLARAVAVGTFQVGPVSADAMYRGEYHSYNGAGTITVRSHTNKPEVQ